MAHFGKATVVIVDDNEMMREVLRVLLRTHDYDVIGEAADGDVGLDMILERRPDVVFLDIMMPTSGLEVLRQVKEKLPGTVVLMITGSRDRETVQAALQGGAGGFILKPFKTGTVIDTLENAILKSRTLS